MSSPFNFQNLGNCTLHVACLLLVQNCTVFHKLESLASIHFSGTHSWNAGGDSKAGDQRAPGSQCSRLPTEACGRETITAEAIQ